MNKALIIIDVQKAFDESKWGNRNNPEAENNIYKLLTKWRERNAEVVFIKHTSQNRNSLFHPKNESSSIIDKLKPKITEKVFTKEVNSAFIGTSLERYLRNININEVVITGLTTPHCISTSTRMSGNLGFKTTLIADATAAFGITDHEGNYIDAQTIHNVSLATLHNEFAEVVSTENVLNNL